MISTDLRTRLRADEPHGGTLHATTVLTASPIVVEALAASPFDALVLDMEHSTLSAADVEQLLRAADVHRTPLLVRVPEIGHDIARVLDAGAAGIIVPQVETPEQAAAAVARARYAPLGRRGLGAARGSVYGAGLGPDFTSDANARTLVAIQIESEDGVRRADEILAVPGVDAVVIGPGDLSLSLGTALGSEAFWSAVETVFEAARRNGVAPGSFCFRDEDRVPFLDRGARVLLVGSDLGWILRGAAEEWDGLRSALGADASATDRTAATR